jgi:hypothetical protein
LNTAHKEHTTKTKISHLRYVVDLKLIGKTEGEIKQEMQVVRNVTDALYRIWNVD